MTEPGREFGVAQSLITAHRERQRLRRLKKTDKMAVTYSLKNLIFESNIYTAATENNCQFFCKIDNNSLILSFKRHTSDPTQQNCALISFSCQSFGDYDDTVTCDSNEIANELTVLVTRKGKLCGVPPQKPEVLTRAVLTFTNNTDYQQVSRNIHDLLLKSGNQSPVSRFIYYILLLLVIFVLIHM